MLSLRTRKSLVVLYRRKHMEQKNTVAGIIALPNRVVINSDGTIRVQNSVRKRSQLPLKG